MIIKLQSYVIQGIKSEPITVECSVAPGLAKFEIIGLADTAIKESKERIFKSLIENGYRIPPGNITINLAPAKIKKRGPLYDLPIILGILLASGQTTTIHNLEDIVIAGELSLDGDLREVEGVFITTLQHQEEKQKKTYLMPKSNAQDFNSFPELKDQVYLIDRLQTAIDQLSQEKPIYSFQTDENLSVTPNYTTLQKGQDFNEVIGHESAKLAIQLSIIGRLNLLLVGPPGGGKSMLVQRIPTILPSLSREESMMVTRIHHASIRKNLVSRQLQGLIKETPFREVHNSVHTTSLIGGGRIPEPGEISLAHSGYLFLDELSEYSKDTLQSLRIPMERKQVTISRVEGQVTYPCDFTLLACTNPCACGYYGDQMKMCSCSKHMIHQFYGRLSGPILDRFDLIIFVHHFDQQEIKRDPLDSATMRTNIKQAIHNKEKFPNPFQNKTMKEIFSENPKLESTLLASMEKNLISFRKVKSILKTCHALSIFYGRKIDQELLFQSIEYCRNKFAMMKQV